MQIITTFLTNFSFIFTLLSCFTAESFSTQLIVTAVDKNVGDTKSNFSHFVVSLTRLMLPEIAVGYELIHQWKSRDSKAVLYKGPLILTKC